MGVPDFVYCAYDQHGVVPGVYQTKSLGREHANYSIRRDGFLFKDTGGPLDWCFLTGPLKFRDDLGRIVHFDFIEGKVNGVVIEGNNPMCDQSKCTECKCDKAELFLELIDRAQNIENRLTLTREKLSVAYSSIAEHIVRCKEDIIRLRRRAERINRNDLR